MKTTTPNILITGATGMLGAHLLYHLVSQGETVRAIKRSSSKLTQTEIAFRYYKKNLNNYSSQIEWLEGDVLNAESLQTAMQNMHTVYHCAAVVSFADNPEALINTNIQGTQNVVDAALAQKVQRFCFVSSIGALGKPAKGQEAIEDTAWGNKEADSLYSLSKFKSEEIVWNAIKKGLNAVIVNPGVILGAADMKNGTMQLFSAVQKGLPIYTKGGSGYVGVEDVCRAMLQLTASPIQAERFVLVSENLSNKDLLFLIADALGKRRPFINGTRPLLMSIAILMEGIGKLIGKKMLLDRGTARVALSRSYYSSAKIKNEIGFEFTPVKKTVEKIARSLEV